MAQDDALHLGRGQRQLQELVGAQPVAQGRGVVPQLADLRRGLVDDDQHAVGQPGRSAGEGRMVPVGQGAGDDGVRRVQAVAGELHLQAGGVPAPDLEAVQRGEGLVQAEQDRQAGGARVPSPERLHLGRGPEAVPADGPQGVLAPDQCGVGGLQLRGLQELVRVVQGCLHRGRQLGQVLGHGGDAGGAGGVFHHGHQAGHAPQGAVDALEVLRGPLEPGPAVRCGRVQQPSHTLEGVQQRSQRHGWAGRLTSDDGDDSAHTGPGLLRG